MKYIFLLFLVVSNVFAVEVKQAPACVSEKLQKAGFSGLKGLDVAFLSPVAATDLKKMYVNMDTLGYLVALKNCSLIFLEKDKKTKEVLVDKLVPCSWDKVASEGMDFLAKMKSRDENGTMMPNFGGTICNSLSEESKNQCSSLCLSMMKSAGGKSKFCSTADKETCTPCCAENK